MSSRAPAAAVPIACPGEAPVRRARPPRRLPHPAARPLPRPLSVAAAMAVLDELESGRIFQNVVDRGEELRERLAALRDDIPLIWDVRGLGLMIGAELRDAEGQPLPAETMQELKLAARDAGVLLSISNTTVILTPPLVISSEESE